MQRVKLRYKDYLGQLTSSAFANRLDSLDTDQAKKCLASSGPNSDTLVVFLKDFFFKFNFEKYQQMTIKIACKLSQHAKSYTYS